MRILYVARLFSGLETSLAGRVWRPAGVPTAYKMIEALDRSRHEPIFVFTAKDFGSDWTDAEDKVIAVDGLAHPMRVLGSAARAPGLVGRARRYRRELHQTRAIIRLAKAERPDLVYVGNANVWAGAWLARSGLPVMFRVMGVYPAMRSALTSSRAADRLLRWSYRAPFAGAIVTQDGSGVETWLDRALDPRVPRHLMLNGVELGQRPAAPHRALAALPADRTKVLFIGRLEPHKGADVFVRAFLQAWRAAPDQIHAIVIGAGEMADELRATVAAAGAERCATFLAHLPHDEIVEAHARADIYVSLNRYGNLSNANLEAMKAGQCMIFPASQPDTGIDLVTDRLVPAEAALRIPSADSADALTEALLALHCAPERRQAMREAMARAAGFIPTWRERLDAELAILEGAAATRARAA